MPRITPNCGDYPPQSTSPNHSTSPKTPASSPTIDVKPSPSSKAASPTVSPSLPNSWHQTQLNDKPQTTSTPVTSEKSTSNPQQYCLRWNNYTSNLTNVFDQLLHNESFVDVTLACDGKSIKAHKMVLSACSPYFQSLFFDNPCQHPIVILRDVKWTELKSAVEFMYKGEINLGQDEIGPLLNVAEMLKIRGLADVKGDHDAIKLEHSSSLPEIIPVAKQPKLNTCSQWDLNKIDFLMRNAASSPSANATTTTTSMRNQRKRNWSNGGATALTSSPSSSSSGNNVASNSNLLNSNTTNSSKCSSGNSNNNNNNNSNLNRERNQLTASPSTPIDGIDAHSQSSMSAEDLPVDASNTPTPPNVRTSGMNIADSQTLSSLSGINIPHTDTHTGEEMEIKPGIAEMIREEERVSTIDKFHYSQYFHSRAFFCLFVWFVFALFRCSISHLICRRSKRFSNSAFVGECGASV